MRATARAQPNIALIKYWGKRDRSKNLPAVGSISLTLESLFTEMTVDLADGLDADRLLVNASVSESMLPRISACLDRTLGADRLRAAVDSRCNFPVAAGLASSASAFAAAVVAADGASGGSLSTAELASLAGRASGSAARSLYGGFVELQNTAEDVSVSSILDADQWPLKVVVAVTADGPKPIGSGEAMEISRRTSPFYARWVEDQAGDLEIARDAILSRDFAKLAEISEHNCLKMHSVMWASRPSIVYWNAATLECLQVIRELRAAGTAVFFTMDAGPQVKAICEAADENSVRDALAATSGVKSVLTSGLGDGARLLSTA